MKYRSFIIVCLSALSVLPLGAQGGRQRFPVFTYGLEWSYTALFNATWHHVFMDEIYSRVNDKGARFLYENHGEILAHIGVNIGENVNISLLSGYSGIIKDVRLVPVSLRCTWFYGKDNGAGRWFSFIDGGSGIHISDTDTPYFSGKAGGGYRIPLSRRVKLDFNIAYRFSYASPDICDDGERVPESSIRRNDNYLSAMQIGIGLTF